ncbi:hypothetical protein HK104_009971 [Borealophlyctis nickersoniae]|nr:hypothetical protein HK104_009971 [Borealophlyctis nickersoniae]
MEGGEEAAPTAVGLGGPAIPGAVQQSQHAEEVVAVLDAEDGIPVPQLAGNGNVAAPCPAPSPNDFLSPVKPKAGAKRKLAEAEEDCQEGNECPICVEKWIGKAKSKKSPSAKCPTCKAPTAKKDILPLYVKDLVVIDTAARDEAIALAEMEKKKSEDLQKENAKLVLLYDVAQKERDQAKAEIFQLKAEIEK